MPDSPVKYLQNDKYNQIYQVLTTTFKYIALKTTPDTDTVKFTVVQLPLLVEVTEFKNLGRNLIVRSTGYILCFGSIINNDDDPKSSFSYDWIIDSGFPLHESTSPEWDIDTVGHVSTPTSLEIYELGD